VKPKILELDNGLRVVLNAIESSRVLSASLWVSAGARDEEREKRGVAHFLEHVIFCESDRFGRGGIDAIVESLGGELNAATSYDYTYYYINLPYYSSERGVELLYELVFGTKITDEAVEKERKIILEEIARSRDNPQELFSEELFRRLFADDERYSCPILGSEESVGSIQREDLERFYRENYTAKRCTLVLSGRIENERELLSEIEKTFGRVEEGSLPERGEVGAPLRGGRDEFEIEHPAVSLLYVSLAWRLEGCSRGDIYYDILDNLLSSGRSSLLYREVRERGIAFGCSSTYQPLEGSSAFIVSAAADDGERALTEIERLLRELPERVREEDFELARAKLYKGEVFGRESAEAQGEALGFALTVPKDRAYYEEFFSDLRSATFKEFKERLAFLSEGANVVGRLKPASQGVC